MRRGQLSSEAIGSAIARSGVSRSEEEQDEEEDDKGVVGEGLPQDQNK